MKTTATFLVCMLSLVMTSLSAQDVMHEKPVTYEHDGITFQGKIAYSEHGDISKPGILMIPNWMAPTKGSLANKEPRRKQRGIKNRTNLI